jgi:hypothetical protein
VADTTGLADYISLTKEVRTHGEPVIPMGKIMTNCLQNITALQTAAVGTCAILTVQYTSRHRPPSQIPKPPTLTTASKEEGKAVVIE